MRTRFIHFLLAVTMCAYAGCANISSPTGGKKDTRAPKLVSVTPKDSLVNTRVKRLELQFDEYIVVGDVQKEVEISPILSVPPMVTGINKHVTLKIEDSLLDENTTYRISFGNAIRDLHEGNAFPGYTYTFSTGSYFDSLELKGNVLNAATGLPDTVDVVVVLYSSAENDTAILKKKPRYKTRPDSKGEFLFKGLPGKSFRIYAIKDDNKNLTYDGEPETVAFNDSLVFPADSAIAGTTLRLFAEIPDTAVKKDTAVVPRKGGMNRNKARAVVTADTNLIFTTNIDTTNKARRTFNLMDSIKLVFNREPVLVKEKINITYDSGDVKVALPIGIRQSKAMPGTVYISSLRWKENTVYTLRFAEGFATDTGGRQAEAGNYTFRTFNDDDYGKITLNVPGKYRGSGQTAGAEADHLLMVTTEKDTVYMQKVTDTVIKFRRLMPATYTFRIIVDKNKNGKWDSGDLLGRRQPELVIPCNTNVVLKAGWEHTIDFEAKLKPGKIGAQRDKGTQKTIPKK